MTVRHIHARADQLSAAQLVQHKGGGTTGSNSPTISNTTVTGQTLTTDTNSPMSIMFTPVMNCYWDVSAQVIWHSTDTTNWRSTRTWLELSPADELGYTRWGELGAHTHGTIQPWKHINVVGDFKLEAGTTYTLLLKAFASAASYMYHYRHNNHLWMRGRTYGHGTF